jgi:hypothetical protein
VWPIVGMVPHGFHRRLRRDFVGGCEGEVRVVSSTRSVTMTRDISLDDCGLSSV